MDNLGIFFFLRCRAILCSIEIRSGGPRFWRGMPKRRSASERTWELSCMQRGDEGEF